MRELTEQERSTLVHGLRVAAERFTEDAATALDAQASGGLGPPGGLAGTRLAEQFERQARESRELATRLEDAGRILVSGEQ